MKLRKSFYRFRAIVLMAGIIVSLGSLARAQDWSQATVVPPVEVETAMRTLLEQMPLLRGTVVKGYVPVHAPLSKRIVHYEAKLDGLQREGNGCVVLNTAGHVVEFTTSGRQTTSG